MVEVLQNFIDGQFVPSARHIDSYNPATGEVHLKIPDSNKEDIEKAVDAANKAFIKYLVSWVIFKRVTNMVYLGGRVLQLRNVLNCLTK